MYFIYRRKFQILYSFISIFLFLTPVITLVLYYGTEPLPDCIYSMIDMPEDKTLHKYIQNYHLNLIRLRELSPTQAELFCSDFACIAKFLSKSYNKSEQLEMLRNNRQILLHTKDILYTLAAITGDKRYLRLRETGKEESMMCEIADALEQIGFERGIEQGIQSMIEACRELGVRKEDALQKVIEKYQLDSSLALSYMDKFWNQS